MSKPDPISDKLNDISNKVTTGHIDLVSLKDLVDWHSKNLSRPDEMEYVRSVIQQRYLLETIKWQKFVAIGTGVLALATFLLVVATFILVIVTFFT